MEARHKDAMIVIYNGAQRPMYGAYRDSADPLFPALLQKRLLVEKLEKQLKIAEARERNAPNVVAHRARHRTDSFSKSSGQSLVWAGPLWTKLQRDGVFGHSFSRLRGWHSFRLFYAVTS
jgi:hypothetical protein